MAEYSISSADLSEIRNNLNAIFDGMKTINSNVLDIDDRVGTVYRELDALATEFHGYVDWQNKVHAKEQSMHRITQIRQELEKKFGHYDEVRRNATGILQADDLGIVRKATISNATEELMISTPGYWLAPSLVALAAWITDQPDLAEKALREGIRRNDEKTSLFWALVCRRADRKSAALKWTQRYLANQEEENLDHKTVIILDAFASGLLGSDTEGVVSKQMGEWLERLSDKPGFIEQQTQQWSDAINLKKKPLPNGDYTYLRKYSHTWPILQAIMEGANLHADILSFFTGIFDQEASTDSLKAQLDEILNSLVTDFDEEEIPLKKEEKYHQFVVDFDGDTKRAKQHMAIEQTAFEEHKDFTQLLTDAAMKPESSHASVSTQKFAIALSKEWISNAYNDVVAQNRMKIPHEIEINLDSFNDKTKDGQNESEIIGRFKTHIDKEEEDTLAKCKLSGFEQFCLWGGIAVGGVGLIMALSGGGFLGIVAMIGGVGMIINHFSKKSRLNTKKQDIRAQFAKRRETGMQIIRAMLAEVVDFRAEFKKRDAESQKVVDFLEQITPDQYVRKLSGTNRKVMISK